MSFNKCNECRSYYHAIDQARAELSYLTRVMSRRRTKGLPIGPGELALLNEGKAHLARQYNLFDTHYGQAHALEETG